MMELAAGSSSPPERVAELLSKCLPLVGPPASGSRSAAHAYLSRNLLLVRRQANHGQPLYRLGGGVPDRRKRAGCWCGSWHPCSRSCWRSAGRTHQVLQNEVPKSRANRAFRARDAPWRQFRTSLFAGVESRASVGSQLAVRAAQGCPRSHRSGPARESQLSITATLRSPKRPSRSPPPCEPRR
jgi:hypothetical protein